MCMIKLCVTVQTTKFVKKKKIPIKCRDPRVYLYVPWMHLGSFTLCCECMCAPLQHTFDIASEQLLWTLWTRGVNRNQEVFPKQWLHAFTALQCVPFIILPLLLFVHFQNIMHFFFSRIAKICPEVTILKVLTWYNSLWCPCDFSWHYFTEHRWICAC